MSLGRNPTADRMRQANQALGHAIRAYDDAYKRCLTLNVQLYRCSRNNPARPRIQSRYRRACRAFAKVLHIQDDPRKEYVAAETDYLALCREQRVAT